MAVSISAWPCGISGGWNYRVYERSAIHDQLRHEAMRIARHEVESSPENQVAHDVVVQIRGPLRHVERLRPIFAVLATLEYDILESLHVLDQIHLR